MLGEIADVKQGLATGDNLYYLFKTSDAIGSYRLIENTKVLTEKEISKIHNDEKLRSKIAEFGISKNMFKGKTIVPYDKGGSSDIVAGRLSNYYSKPEFFIDWSESNVQRIKTLTTFERDKQYNKKSKATNNKIASRFQNIENYFKPNLTVSIRGIYAPTFRLGANTIFDVMGSCIFPKTFSNEYLLGMFCSKFIKYILKCFMNNSIAIEIEELKKIQIPICEKSQKQEIEKLVKEIIKKQKKDPDYNYQNHEQKEIDKLVYEIFGLDQELIDEVETWYERRYYNLFKGSKTS